ncbi:MAG: DUF2231 domain-containing protein [Tannerellaceae bacterium]
MFNETHIHPMFVHFPIALGMFGYLIFCITVFFKQHSDCFKFFSFLIMLFATIAAICTAITGSYFTFHLSGEPNTIENIHSNLAGVTVTLFSIGSVAQLYSKIFKKDFLYYKWAVFAIYTAAFFAVMITGYYGGSIVYDYLINKSLVGQ